MPISCGREPSSWRWVSGASAVSRPFQRILPWVGRARVASMRINVDLPAPARVQSQDHQPGSRSLRAPLRQQGVVHWIDLLAVVLRLHVAIEFIAAMVEMAARK